LTLLSIEEAIQKIEEFSLPFDDSDAFFESKVHFDAVLIKALIK
jgi:hypothetical protein